ncbi:hypothetical protein HFO06_35030 [Rhizobium leguminosarum]|nr:hypothetical protein [Rhizobium leguminosarum]MBY5809328.1 hypothetical protein [Rhizobium leguminosarum]
MKSGPDRYGAIAVSIHWLSAILILALLGSGFRAANAMDAATKAGLLRFFHAGAALYHQFVRGDHLLRRMWYGG